MASSRPHADNIAAPPALVAYPSYAELAKCEPYRHVSLFARAPWLRPNALEEEGLLEQYVVAGFLPDGLPVDAVHSPEWQKRCYIPDNQIWLGVGRRRIGLTEGRVRLTRAIYQRIERMGILPVDPYLAFDTWLFRTPEEAQYGPLLANALTESKAWYGTFEPKQAALVAKYRYLPEGYQVAERFGPRGSETDHYRRWYKFERHQRAATGYLVPYQAIEIQHISHRALRGRYVAVPTSWQLWEVPKGLHVELPAVLTYAWTALVDRPSDGAWCIFYTEWIAQVGAACLWEAYSSCRLFWLPPKVVEGIRKVDLGAIMGEAGYAKLLSLLALMEAQPWASVTPANRLPEPSGRREPYVAILRSDAGGHWVYLDPLREEVLEADEAKSRRLARITALQDTDVAMVAQESQPDGAVVTSVPEPAGNESSDPFREEARPPATVSVLDYEEESLRLSPMASVVAPRPLSARRRNEVAPGGNKGDHPTKVARVADEGSVRESMSRSSASTVTRRFGTLGVDQPAGSGALPPAGPSQPSGTPAQMAIDTDSAKLAFLTGVLRTSGLLGSAEPSSLDEAMSLMANFAQGRKGSSFGSFSASTANSAGSPAPLLPKPLGASAATATVPVGQSGGTQPSIPSSAPVGTSKPSGSSTADEPAGEDEPSGDVRRTLPTEGSASAPQGAEPDSANA